MKIKKKVLFTAHVDSHILAFHIPYLKMFQEKGYEVHVATNGTAEIPHCDVRHTVSFHRSPFKLDNLRAIGQLKKIVDREHYDIIHTHTPMGGVVTRLAALDARKKGTRVIYTAHGFHFFKGAPVLNWLIYYPIEWLLARKTDDLITINKEDYQRAKAQFKTKVHYVPGVGIDPKKFDVKMTEVEKSKLRKSLGLKDSDFVMIYVAELSKRKNQTWLVETLCEFFGEHPDAHLLLPGKDSLNGKLHKLVEKLGLQNQVHLLGFRKDIPQLMKISDLAVSSSKQEGLPVNIMEAMTVGLPVIATSCRGVAELIIDGETGYVVPLGANKELKDSILRIYNDKNLAKDLGEAGRQLAESYILDTVIGNVDNLYSEGSSA